MSAFDVVPALYEADHSTGGQGRWQWSVLTEKERDRYRRQVTPVLAALRLLPEAARRAYAASLVPPEPEPGHRQHSLLDPPEPDGLAAQLREALLEQWELNHSERCDRDWPHPPGVRCHWPPPASLAGHAMPTEMATHARLVAADLTRTVRAMLTEAGADPALAGRVVVAPEQLTVVWDDSPLLPQPGAPELDLLDHDPTVSP